ncbi:unnamed protein product [Tilletia laevis]|uniref:Uncharacterized protein n=3 Tax=Tilletia TaxID=13289 RepID=A0A8X7MIN0_9BASI|nr:hypothetical protein CF328_g8756 [Tilletia controversa]KAE8182040.1 hypothetical protein CF335_g8754 [Tilletia laevis]KAE8238927.1 hypothetical protein A4X03_0g8743 [Tilletia caries]KAE8186445.1 hypothetical protein CF336_g6984 [Tilletia laevis]KAE8237423.1 hypothetical protein A4X06_0g9234 [Tilletia controversa]
MQINFLLNHPLEQVTEHVPTEDEIIEAVLDKQEEETEEDIVEMGGWKPKTKVRARDALHAARVLEQWAMEQPSFDEASASKVRQVMSIVRNKAQGAIFSGARQTSINDFFQKA